MSKDKINIKGKLYLKHQIDAINADVENMVCPFSCDTSAVATDLNKSLQPRGKTNLVYANSSTVSRFNHCLGMYCMAFDVETKSCLRCK